MAQPKPKVGRPSLKTPELVDAICERLARGEPLARICDDEKMPNFSTVWRWDQDDEEFRKLSARARDVGTHYIADDCLSIADNENLKADDKRIRIDTRIRLIGKWNAKRYGDATTLKHADADGNTLPEVDDTARAIRIAAVLNSIGKSDE